MVAIANGAATKITAPFYTRLKQNHRFKEEVPLLHASIHLKPTAGRYCLTCSHDFFKPQSRHRKARAQDLLDTVFTNDGRQ